MNRLTFSTLALLGGIMFFVPVTAIAGDVPANHDHHQAVTVIAEDYAMEMPDELPSGWTSLRYENQGEEPHLMILARLPDGVTFDDYATDVVKAFNDVWYAVRDDGLGMEEAVERLDESLPEWFAEYRFMGGSGILPAGASSTITVNLEPGNYVAECYFKNEAGEFHAVEGMIRELTVTDERSSVKPPEADVRITLFNYGMDIEGELTPGHRTVEVYVKEQPEAGFGHNVHVARVDADTDVDELIRRMNFLAVDGMRTPAPVTFAGGMQILPEGATGYFTMDVEPGEYLLLSELTGHKGVLERVSVSP